MAPGHAIVASLDGGPGLIIRRWRGAAAFGAAALFAVHPIQTEAVGYVSGRSEVLCAVWFVASLLLARGALITGSLARGAAAVACGVLAAASKETGLMLPLVVFAYDRLFCPGEEAARKRRLWRVYAPALAPIVSRC